MSQKLSVVLKFETYDDLVLSYSGPLSQGKVEIKTKTELPHDASVLVKLEISSTGDYMELEAKVDKASAAPDDKGRYSAWVRFSGDESKRQLEQFVLRVAEDQTPESTEPERRQLTVVVVDDSPAQRELASRPFIERGDIVHIAKDGLEGLGLCLKEKPDIILSDVQMPKVDGWQLLRMLKARNQLANVPVIFLTTLSSEADRLRGYRLGVDDYLAKPYASSVLVEHVDRAVQRAKVGAHSWAPVAADALRGDLQQVSLPALLSFLELERKTGTVHLEPKGSVIVLHEGRPVRARSLESDSVECKERALLDLLDLRRGRFEFVAGDVDPEDTINAPLSMLLLEHARRCDEAAQAG